MFHLGDEMKQGDSVGGMPRLLFTGRSERMMDNVVALIPDKYEITRCQPLEHDFSRAVSSIHPHIVIVCLQNETRDMLRVYDMLWMDEIYANLPVLVIGYEEDCKQFRTRLPIRHLKTLTRPLDLELLMQTLKEFVAISKENQGEASPQPDSTPQKPLPAAALEQQEEPTDALSVDELGELAESERELVRKTEHLTKLYGRKNILVVDDDVRMLNVIKLYLQDLYEVSVVPSGKLALKYIAKKPCDMILLDYMMPDMDGPEVLRQIREGQNNAKVPVVFLTGVADKDMVVRSLEFFPNGYLLKPIAREALLEKVTEVVLEL